MLLEVRIMVPFVGLALERGARGASGMLLKGEGLSLDQGAYC